MIALPAKFRIKVYNGTGVTIAAHDITVKVCLQKYDESAVITESAVQTLFDSASTLANLAYEAGTWFDNTTAHWAAFHGLVYTNTTGAPNGTIKVYLENTTDPAATSNSPSDGRGWMLLEVVHAAAGATTRPIKV
jgi:hypothetical protein